MSDEQNDRRRRLRRIIRIMVAIDVVVLLALGALWLVKGDELRRGDSLRGSQPPAGEHMPAYSKLDLKPNMPKSVVLSGHSSLVAATCIDCQSGDIYGGFLHLLTQRKLPDGAQLHVIVWGGDAAAWKREWSIPKRIQVHVADDGAATTAVKDLAHVDDSGIAYLYDDKGIWRSTFHAGQLNADDVTHDLRAID